LRRSPLVLSSASRPAVTPAAAQPESAALS